MIKISSKTLHSIEVAYVNLRDIALVYEVIKMKWKYRFTAINLPFRNFVDSIAKTTIQFISVRLSQYGFRLPRSRNECDVPICSYVFSYIMLFLHIGPAKIFAYRIVNKGMFCVLCVIQTDFTILLEIALRVFVYQFKIIDLFYFHVYWILQWRRSKWALNKCNGPSHLLCLLGLETVL